jgi:uncharacterized protein YyaL (SSP411 family)
MRIRAVNLPWKWTLAVALFLPGPIFAGAKETSATISWEGWSASVFERARQQNRFVLLDLGTVWCHWCHVMEETTYKDPKVVALVGARYLPIHVDADSRPDLANRYEDYGWPATIVFDASGQELVKFAGYIAPARMASLLEAIIEDPTPGPSARAEATPAPDTADATLTPALRANLVELMSNRYDAEQGGWGFAKKYVDWDAVEYSMVRGREGDANAEKRARETLEKELELVDPVWGGVYQYSHGGNWDNPHFEKIMQFQAENLRTYAQAYSLYKDARQLQAARDIHRYLRGFLKSPTGAFYVSQDADLVEGEHGGEYFALSDAERRKRGIPRVDTHLYARENGWAAYALTALYAATGEQEILDEALATARWIVEKRALPGGGFRHGEAETDPAGPYMGDTVAAGRAFLALYAATGDRVWLAKAEQAAEFVGVRFRQPGVAGFVTAAAAGPLPSRPQREENILMARFANLLYRYSGKPLHRELAQHAMRYLATPEVATRFESGGVLLADRELASEPLHVTIVGAKDDPQAQRLLLTALADPASYKRVELWDRRDGPLPNSDVEYPTLAKAAAFVCTSNRCSVPATTPEQLAARLAKAWAKADTVTSR